MLQRLVNIARLEEQRPRGRQTAVTAARAYLDLTEPNPREVLLRLLDGDRAALKAWCRETIESITREEEGGTV